MAKDVAALGAVGASDSGVHVLTGAAASAAIIVGGGGVVEDARPAAVSTSRKTRALKIGSGRE